MPKIMKTWFNVWLYVISIMGGGVFFILIYNFNEMTFQQKSLGFLVFVLLLHILEENEFPGGFFYMYNSVFAKGTDESLFDRYPMNHLSDMITNFCGMIISTMFFFFSPNNICVIIWLIVCIIEVPGHLVTGYKIMKKLSGKGKKTIYSPGFTTTVFGFLPLGVYMFIGLINANITLKEIVLGLVLGAIVNFSAVQLPEKILKNKDTIYVHDEGYGYFDKFLK